MRQYSALINFLVLAFFTTPLRPPRDQQFYLLLLESEARRARIFSSLIEYVDRNHCTSAREDMDAERKDCQGNPVDASIDFDTVTHTDFHSTHPRTSRPRLVFDRRATAHCSHQPCALATLLKLNWLA